MYLLFLLLWTEKSRLGLLRLLVMSSGIAGLATFNVWAEAPSIQNGCGGTLPAQMMQIAAPYQQAVAALKGTETGWCALAAEHSASTREEAVMWEFISAAYVLHTLRGRTQINPAQQAALNIVLARVPDMGKPPTRLREVNTAFYWLARTLAADDQTNAQIVMHDLEKYAPAVYRTLKKRSYRWGDADDNG